MKNLPLFFIHIPKTAGTSFRKSAENLFNKAYTLYDYSPKAPETSSLIRETIYEKNDHFELATQINDFDIRFLSGHVSATKYVHTFGVKNSITFLRDPVQRLISEYQHFVRNNDYIDDFKSFYTKPQFIDRQSKMLHGVPLKALGFVGLTEQYQASLDGINQLFNLNFANLDLNIGRKNKHSPYELDENTLEHIKTLNKVDIQLYEAVCQLFEDRRSLEKNGFSFVHGDMQQCTEKQITGWAYCSQHNEPIDVLILRNNEQIGEVKAADLRPGMLRLGLPRNGYIGFHFNFKQPCKPGDHISCRVADSDQELASFIFAGRKSA